MASYVPSLDSHVITLARRDPVCLRATETVAEALQRLRRESIGERIVYFYVTNELGKLAGVVPTRRLLLSDPAAAIADVMVHPVISVHENDPFGSALETLVARRLLALPVVDDTGRLRGVIDLASFTPMINPEWRGLTEEAFQMAGVHVEQERSRSIWWVMVNRFPWLLCNICSGLAAAMISNLFHDLLQTFVALAFFIPLVLTLAESVAMQSVTMSLQSPKARTSATREIRVGLLLGLVSGAIVGLFGEAWLGAQRVAAVVAVSIFVAAGIGAALGRLAPRLVYRLKLDPKIASGPATLALTDIVALTCYFGLAALALR